MKIRDDAIEVMTPDADTLHRGVKMALDTGEVASVTAGYNLFRSYRLAVSVGPEVAGSAAHQAALLTIVNTARRAILGGVIVAGNLDAPLLAPVPCGKSLADAVVALGGRIENETPRDVPVLSIGGTVSSVLSANL